LHARCRSNAEGLQENDIYGVNMRNTFATLFIILFSLFFVVLIVTLNFYSTVNKPAKVKAILDTSGVYDTAAYYIRQNIVEENSVSMDQGKTLEDLNELISAQSIKSVFDDTIDHIYKAIGDPTKENLKFDVRFSPSATILGQDLTFEKKVNLTGNPVINYLSKIGLVFLALISISALWLSLAILTAKGAKFKWLASSLLVPGVIIFCITLSFYLAPQQYYEFLADKINFVKDPILLNGFRRLIENLANSLRFYFALESAIIAILIGLFYYLGSLYQHEKLEFMNIGKMKK